MKKHDCVKNNASLQQHIMDLHICVKIKTIRINKSSLLIVHILSGLHKEMTNQKQVITWLQCDLWGTFFFFSAQEALDSPFLDVFEAQLDKATAELIYR